MDNPLEWPEVVKGGLGALYGVFSEDDFWLGESYAALSACPDFAQNPDLNTEKFYAADTKPARVLEAVQTMPFLGAKRLVVLSGADEYKAAQLAEFVDYLASPVDFATLVFMGHKLDMRTKFAKELKKRGGLKVFKKMYPRELGPWLQNRARIRGKRLAGSAAAEMVELSELGLGALDSEIEKLSLFVGDKPEISLEDLHAMTGGGRLYSIFDLTDAVAAGDLARALNSHNQLNLLGEPAVKIVVMLQRLFKQLSQAGAIMAQGGGERGVQKVLRTPPKATGTLCRRASRENPASLARAMEAILEADVLLKSSPASDAVVVQRLLMRLCKVGG